MNLFETTQIIKRWIHSCDKPEQLDLLGDIIKEFIVIRFTDISEKWEIDEAASELVTELNQRRIIIAGIQPNTGEERMPRIVEGL